MFYNIKTGSMGANGRGRGRVGTPYYIIRARMKDGGGGVDGVNGREIDGVNGREIDGDGTPRWESRSGTFFTGRGKHVYKGGERYLPGGGKGRKGKEELSRRKKEGNEREEERRERKRGSRKRKEEEAGN